MVRIGGKRAATFGALLALAAAPLAAQPSAAADPALPAAPAVDCAALAAERAGLEPELASVRALLADLALGKSSRKKKGVSGGDVARGAAGAAAGILLPFPLGIAVNAGAAASRKKDRPEPAQDVPALIARQHRLEARLAEIAAARCP